MSDVITLTGVVASPPRAITTQEGLAITSFRLASSQRRFDRAQQKWVDGEPNNQLAHPSVVASRGAF
jgi:single-strand DNA-binding protein